jgi:polyhydroxybutyrate depolymerase
MRVLAAFLVLFALVACNGDGQEETPAAPASTPTEAAQTPEPVSGGEDEPTPTLEPTPTQVTPTATVPPEPLSIIACNEPLPGAVSPGVSSVRELESGGMERSYRVYLPPTYRPSTAVPVALNLHGLGSSAEEQEALSGLRELAAGEGFALVSAEGAGAPARWSVPGFFPSGVDDVAFVEELLQDLATIVCFDAERVYATGFGSGGFMASLLACELPHRFAAIAPVAGIAFPGGCGPALPMLTFHGTGDDRVPFAGGALADSDEPYAGMRAHLADWADLGNCRADAYPQPVSPQASYEGYGDCDEGATVAAIVVEGMGHEWPTKANAGVLAAERIWEFFTEYRLAGD